MSDIPMVHASAHISTDRPQRYVKQLVSHLGRKLTTSLADGVGTVAFPQGRCVLTCHPGFIQAQAAAVDAEQLALVEDVVGRHLVRFAPEGELSVTWVPA